MSKYPDEKECLRLLKDAGCDEDVIDHCIIVTKFAVKIAKLCNANIDLVTAGGLLHDIGRSKTHGMRHAVEGAEIARKLKLPDEIVLIIERHIGAGLTKEDAKSLGLPIKDYIPVTLEQKIVAHADNLIATHDKQTVKQLAEKWKVKGHDDGVRRLRALHKELSQLCHVDLDALEL